MIKLKKIALSLVGLVALAGCSLDFTNDTSSVPLPVAESKEAYALKTASALSLLSDFTSAAPLSTMNNRAERYGDDEERPEQPTEEEIVIDVEKYLGIMQQLLDENPIQVVQETPDIDGYDYKLVVTTTDLSGATSVFVMYYNEVNEDVAPVDSEEIEDSEEESEESELVEESEDSELVAPVNSKYHGQDDHRGGENSHEDDDDEIGEIELIGIVIVNDVTYNLTGEKDEDEVSFFIDLDDLNYIKVSQEIDENETSLKYTIVQNGVKTKLSFKTEIEDDETVIKLTQSIDGVDTKYTFIRRTVEEQEVLFVKILDEALELDVKLFVFPTYDEETGLTTYTYEIVGSNGRYTHQTDHGYHHGHGHGRG